jgi:hypothetical protein
MSMITSAALSLSRTNLSIDHPIKNNTGRRIITAKYTPVLTVNQHASSDE